jgi:hypothetical protein
MRAGHNKRLKLGVADQADAGFNGSVGGDADMLITRALAREEKMHALNSIQKINASHGTAKGGDELKAEELIAVVRELRPPQNDRTAELLVELLKSERERNAQFMAQQSQRNPLEMLAPVAAPLFAFLDKKLSPGTVGKWIEMLRNPAEAPVAQESFWTGLRSLLSEYAPVIQPMLVNLMQQNGGIPKAPRMGQPAMPMPTPPSIPSAVRPPTDQPGGEDDMQRDYEDPDTKDVLDYVMTCLDEHKYPEAWAALRTCEDTQDVIAAIVPGADPTAFWFAFRNLDDRLKERKDASLEFIRYIQQQIETFVQQQQAQAQAGAEPPAPASQPA